MSKYIKIFNTESEYNAYSGGTDFITPNISYVKGTDKTKYDENEIRSYKEPSWIEPTSLDSFTSTTLNKIASYITSVEIPSGVTSISYQALSNCDNLTSVMIPSGVTSIGEGAFSNCYGLTSVTIPSGVTSIAQFTFSNCYRLTSVTIPSGVTKIGYGAFQSCSGLTSIEIPSGVTSISGEAFKDCSGLTSIEIPSGVTSISYQAFRDCSNLTSVTINATVPPTLGANGFYNTNNCPIYVPNESVEAYKTATNWSAYAGRIQPIPNE